MNKKIKKADGSIVEVGNDYQLKDGEVFIEAKKEESKELGSKQELTIDELKTIVSDTFKESELAKEVTDLKAQVKSLSGEKVDDTEAKAEEVKTFVNDLVHNKISDEMEKKTITTDSGSFGYTVPTLLADKVHETKDKIAKIRPNAFTFKMAGKFQLPTQGTGVTAYWITTEADTDLTQSNPTTSKKDLDDWYLASRVRIPYKLLSTSGINITDYISRLSARAIVSTEETAFIGGAGTSSPEGIRNAGITGIAQSGASLAYDDLVSLFYGVPEQYRGEGKWLASNAAIQLIRKLKDDNGLPFFNVNDQTIFGKKLFECTDIPSNLGSDGDETEIYFGDLQEYWIKDGENMLAETRKVSGRLQVDMYLYEATDGVLANTDAFRYLSAVV